MNLDLTKFIELTDRHNWPDADRDGIDGAVANNRALHAAAKNAAAGIAELASELTDGIKVAALLASRESDRSPLAEIKEFTGVIRQAIEAAGFARAVGMMTEPGDELPGMQREPQTPAPAWPAGTSKPVVIEVDEDTRIFRPPATENSKKYLDTAVRKIFGERVRWARIELNALSTMELFPLLGFENQPRLMRLEAGDCDFELPFSVVALAAQVLGVTADFLLGVTDQFEDLETPEAAFRRRLVSQWSVLMHRSTTEHGRRMARFAGLAQVVANSVDLGVAAHEVIERFSRMCELNVDQWEELRGGAPLLAAMDNLKGVLRQAERHAAHTCQQLRADEVARADLEPLIEILGEMAVRFRGREP